MIAPVLKVVFVKYPVKRGAGNASRSGSQGRAIARLLAKCLEFCRRVCPLSFPDIDQKSGERVEKEWSQIEAHFLAAHQSHVRLASRRHER